MVDIVLSVDEKEIDREFNCLMVFINELTAVDLLQPDGQEHFKDLVTLARPFLPAHWGMIWRRWAQRGLAAIKF